MTPHQLEALVPANATGETLRCRTNLPVLTRTSMHRHLDPDCASLERSFLRGLADHSMPVNGRRCAVLLSRWHGRARSSEEA